MMVKYEHMVISGGGIYGFSFLGSIKVLIERGYIDLKGIKSYCGSSIGGFISVLLNIGYTVDEILKVCTEIDFKKYQNIRVANIINNLGIDDGVNFMKFIRAIIKQKVNPDITFKELYMKTGALLTLTGSCINKGTSVYFNKNTYPDMKISDAIRITISFPPIFTPVKLGDDIFIDGAFFNILPMRYVRTYVNKADYDKIVGFILDNKGELKINNLNDYMFSIFKGISKNITKLSIKGSRKNIIRIEVDSGFSMNLNIDYERKMELYNYGYRSTIKFLDKLTF